jgi:hypothetical protein
MGAGEEGPAVGAGPRWAGNSHQEEKHEAWPSHGTKKCVAEWRAGAQSSAPGAGIDGRTAGTRSTEASRTTASRGEALIRSCRGLRQSTAARRGGFAPAGRWSRWRAGWGVEAWGGSRKQGQRPAATVCWAERPPVAAAGGSGGGCGGGPAGGWRLGSPRRRLSSDSTLRTTRARRAGRRRWRGARVSLPSRLEETTEERSDRVHCERVCFSILLLGVIYQNDISHHCRLLVFGYTGNRWPK